MFTGIIEAMGRVVSLDAGGESGRLILSFPQPFGPIEQGESVAVDGVCLTAKVASAKTFSADVSWETLSRTTLGKTQAGETVNLERALRPIDRLGGHFVSGHVDGVGTIRHIERHGESWELAIESPECVLDACIEKGSIAVDGISLTIATLADSIFTCAIIPHTLESTTLKMKRPGDAVNLESDLIGKYVRRFLGNMKQAASPITLETLERTGFV